MGHKVHPKIHRTQVIYTWDSKWFSRKNYALHAKQDISIREYLAKKCKDSLIEGVRVERGAKNMTVTIFAAKPGFIIGRGGSGLDEIRKHIETKILKMEQKVKLNVQEVYQPALAANVVAQTIANDIEKRVPFRRIMKQTISRVMDAGAQGVKIRVSGRLNGAEIARAETLSAGTVPLITLRSDINYALVRAETIYGTIGVKVWICQGQVFGRKDRFEQTGAPPKRRRRTNNRTGRPNKGNHSK